MRYYFCVLAALLMGCSTVDDPTANRNQSGASASALVLDVTVEPLVLERGGTLAIRLTVTNESNVSVVKGFASGCIYGFAIWHRGDVISPPPPICTMNAPTVTYAPGEVITKEFEWTWDDPDIKPGIYRVVAGFGPRGEGPSAPPVEVRLQ
jgi:hypothetical protein